MVEQLKEIASRFDKASMPDIGDVLRRLSQTPGLVHSLEEVEVVSHSQFSYDPRTRELRGRSGADIRLTQLEAAILQKFAANVNRVVPHGDMVKSVWGYDEETLKSQPAGSLVKGHIRNLRHKLKSAGADADLIKTHTGSGYSLIEPADMVQNEPNSNDLDPKIVEAVHQAGYILVTPDRRQEGENGGLEPETAEEIYMHPQFRFFPERCCVQTNEGKVFNLTAKEMLILLILARNSNKVVPHQEIVDFVWEGSEAGDASMLKTHITHIRRKLDSVGVSDVDGRKVIQNVKNVGYCLRDSRQLVVTPQDESP